MARAYRHLGRQDILLRPWTYFVLTVILLLVPLQKLNLAVAVRARVAVIMGLTVLGYVVAVYLIFFLTYTPLNIDHVRGVQGRYFVIALPMAAIFLASMADVDLPRGVLATIERPIAGGFSHQREMATRHDRRIGGIRDLAIELASEHDAIHVRFDALLGFRQRPSQMSNDEHDRFLLSTGHPVGLFGSHL